MSTNPNPNSNPRAREPEGWREILLQSKAEIAAGQTVPLQPVLDRLRATAERLEAKLRLKGTPVNPGT